MINRKTLIGLAIATLVLFVGAAAIGQDTDFLWIVDDITWYGFLACALALVVFTVAVLVKSLSRSRRSAG
jgi:hypothetical protein